MALDSLPSFPVLAGRHGGSLNFTRMNEQEILSLAIALEEDDARIYNTYADALAADYPDTAQLFRAMAAEEDGHRHRLIELYRKRFGERILLIRREDVRGFVALAVAVVAVELVAIAWVRRRYMETPFGLAVLQVIVGGLLVFAAGVLIGEA